MHLVSDTSVPAHVRNDAHVFPYEFGGFAIGSRWQTYESWAKRKVISNTAGGLNFSGVLPTPGIFSHAKSAPLAPIPISALWDTDTYIGSDILTATGFEIGLAEYTNANFFSEDTIFKDYPHPAYADTNYNVAMSSPVLVDAEDGKLDSRVYIKKIVGDVDTRLAAFSYITYDVLNKGMIQFSPLILDDKIYADYAALLIPRAVGYSAALLDYFFRGDIRLEYTTTPRPGFVIKNKTDENMDGLFKVLYDNKNDQRVKNMSGNFSLGKQSAGAVFDITHPSDAKEPGKYIIAFRGTMGNEKEAVAGYVTTRLLEITPPAQFIYSMTDGSGADPYFRNIRAKVKNASPGEQMKTGTILAVAKYKLDTADPVFLYSISDPQPIDLSSGDPAELNFDFDYDPIPLDITDLYLEVVFKGTIGNETDAIASGIKDISEPTPIDIFNDTDKSCINGVWYPAADAIDLMDTHWPKIHIADTWDVNPHLLKDIYIKLSPMTNPEMASSAVYNSMVPFLYPGEFRRAMYMLSDYRFKYSFHETWSGAPGFTDYGQHGTRVSTYEGTAVTNQTDYTSDPAVCGRNLLCTIYRYPGYYSLRNYQMWWGGGLVYINWPYPYNSSCQGF
jgi:hypothetical protein